MCSNFSFQTNVWLTYFFSGYILISSSLKIKYFKIFILIKLASYEKNSKSKKLAVFNTLQ